MKVAIISDVHGNIEALKSVAKRLGEMDVQALVLLGDLIDYGMHSNEVIEWFASLKLPVLCNIWGNHENAIMTENFEHFSSKRGEECAKYTASVLNEASKEYIQTQMVKDGLLEFSIGKFKCLAVHGSLKDYFWKSIAISQDYDGYEKYDYVMSGHSHLPHYFEVFYATDDAAHRNKKKTIFINPGSVGQPRNLCNLAQFAILDTDNGTVLLEKVSYDIEKEQKAFTGQVDEFYKTRLETGV